MVRPNPDLMRQHIEFILSGMDQYSDGRFHICFGFNSGNSFAFDQVEEAIAKAIEFNERGNNIYICGAIFSPDAKPYGRLNDSDFYATSVLWADIDTPQKFKVVSERTVACPPNIAIKTSSATDTETGKRALGRYHIWWKLNEAIDDEEQVIEALSGLSVSAGDDEKVKNVSRLMRLAGAVSHPKADKEDRIEELTYFKNLNPFPLSIDAVLRAYPAPEFVYEQPAIPNGTISLPVVSAPRTVANGLDMRIADGRDEYMSDMIYAAIIHLTAKHGRWPTVQEVLADAWPEYERKVITRNPQGLDAEGRGQKLMIGKIKSKLSAFERGRMRGLETVQAVMVAGAKPVQNTKEPFKFDPETGELIETEVSLSSEETKPVLPYKWASEITGSIESNTFIEKLMERGRLSVIYGESNCGKSFFATDLAFHVAEGKRWRGRRVDKGAVIYLALEGSHGLENRIAAYKIENENPDLLFALVSTQVNLLDTSAQSRIPALINTIREISNGMETALVIVDTLARAASGGDENSGQDMSLLVGNADAIREATGAHVCFIHHSGKDKARGARGHSSLRAAVDTEIEISRGEEDNYSKVTISKQRDLEIGEPMYFELKRVVLGVNKFTEEVTSCVVRPIENIEPVKKQAKQTSVPAKFLLDALRNAVLANGRFVTINGNRVEAVSYDDLQVEMVSLGEPPFKDMDAVLSRTSAARKKLRGDGLIGMTEKNIWLIND